MERAVKQYPKCLLSAEKCLYTLEKNTEDNRNTQKPSNKFNTMKGVEKDWEKVTGMVPSMVIPGPVAKPKSSSSILPGGCPSVDAYTFNYINKKASFSYQLRI